MDEENPAASAAREALWLTLQLGGPPLAAILVVGLAVSVLQALTQVQEGTLAFLPKLAVLGAVLVLLGPRMTQALVGYGEVLLDRAVAIGGLR